MSSKTIWAQRAFWWNKEVWKWPSRWKDRGSRRWAHKGQNLGVGVAYWHNLVTKIGGLHPTTPKPCKHWLKGFLKALGLDYLHKFLAQKRTADPPSLSSNRVGGIISLGKGNINIHPLGGGHMADNFEVLSYTKGPNTNDTWINHRWKCGRFYINMTSSHRYTPKGQNPITIFYCISKGVKLLGTRGPKCHGIQILGHQ